MLERVVLGSPVSEEGQRMRGRLFIPGGDVRGPGSERRGPLPGLDAVNPLEDKEMLRLLFSLLEWCDHICGR